jgi:alkylation response protein AidB-like acyl-CoA dehydrogenase
MIYRTCGLIDTALAAVDRTAEDVGAQSAKSIAEYAIECSINKVYCSEMLAHVADEAVQMYGGYGYTEEYPVERIYRDCKIFRIYEGTNEINRVIIAGWLMRKALKNDLPLSAVAEQVRGDLFAMGPLAPRTDDGPLGYQRRLLDRAKRALVLLCDAAARKYGTAIEDEQEILGPLSNIAIEVYAMDCGLLRALKAVESVGEEKARMKVNIARLYVNDAMDRVAGCVRQILPTMEIGEELEGRLAVFRKLLQFTPINSAQVRNDIADDTIEVGRYTC